MTKINYDFLNNLLSGKITLKNDSDKIKLSNYEDYLPMYDIYSNNIYLINKENIHYRLIDCHYRFINDEIFQWIKNKLSKSKLENDKIKYNRLLLFINNYKLDQLEKTSYETLYKYSPQLGLSISICKRNSFHPYSKHLNPYYTKNELIKLGLNNKIIKSENEYSLRDKNIHYEICKLVSKNDISVDTIREHMKVIINKKIISWICFYSLTGSYRYNEFLRKKNPNLPKDIGIGISNISNQMISIDSLEKDYYFYRFIVDDKFIKNLKIGDYYEDKGFLSTTRDPFYSPGLSLDFGIILMKINIPKKIKGSGLFIENFSLFPKEEEYLLNPNMRLKLISKDEKFKYYHINNNFEKLVRTKYEFTLEQVNQLKTLNFMNEEIPNLNLDDLDIDGRDRVALFENFISMCNSNQQFIMNSMIFNCEWFDSSNVYKNFYVNSTKDGFSISQFQNGYPVIFIEFGDTMVVNYIKKKYYYDEYVSIDFNKLEDIVSKFAYIFRYQTCKIFFDYKNFSEFEQNYKKDKEFLYNNLYCENIYTYLKSGKKRNDSKFVKYEYGYWQLDTLKKKKIPSEIINLLPKDYNSKSWAELIIKIIEEKFFLYEKLEKWCNYYNNKLFEKNYLIFDCNLYLKSKGIDVPYYPNFETVSLSNRPNYNTIYRLNTRRV
jgi:hypothetical protein